MPMPAEQPAIRHRLPTKFVHRVLGFCVAWGICALLVNTWLVQGLWAPVIVASGSMAPRLLGSHRHWQCAGCGRDFNCLAESLPGAGVPVICPNCGAHNSIDAGADRPGTRVWIDQYSLTWRPITRWETVVFRNPENPGTLCVKRVVGLPGETVQLSDGNVWIDGQVARKTAAQQTAMAVPVYETPVVRRSNRELEQRWEIDARRQWSQSNGRFVHRRGSPPTGNAPIEFKDRIDWLTYRHRETFVAQGQPDVTVILDASPCDQAESRVLNPVPDLIMRCGLRASSPGLVYVRAQAGGDELVLELNVATGNGTLRHNGESRAAIAAAQFPFARRAQLDFVLADHQLQLAIDNRLLAAYSYVPTAIDDSGRSQAIAIGAKMADIEVDHLQILRDVYYLPAVSQGEQCSYQLGPKQYFVLGDNSPHSSDSRNWLQGVSASLIVGRPIAW